MATTIRGGERRPHQNYNHRLDDDDDYTAFAPPSSPFPTISGVSRASPADISINEYLSSTSLQIPRLHHRLPDPLAPSTSTSTSGAWPGLQPKLPAQIDMRLLASGVGNSIERLMKSANEFGMIRMTGHGISTEELGAAKAVVSDFFRRLDERKNRFRRSFVERIGNREEFVWFLSDKALSLWAREVMGPTSYREFSYKMESLVKRLDKISEDLADVFLRNSERKFERHIQESESIISIYRYNDTNPSLLVSNEDCHEINDHALGLHLAMEHGEFFANTDKGPLSFGIDPDTIVVTIGDQLVEWSGREFKCAAGEVLFDPNLNGTEVSFHSLELKCSPLNLNFGYTKKNTKKISIVDQILFLLFLGFLYKLFFPLLQDWVTLRIFDQSG